MATGYLVNSGLDPYKQYDFAGVFSSPLFVGVIPRIGYPPPWPLVLGLVYRFSFGVLPNLFFYNFAIKVPVILGNVGLAYLVRNVLRKSNASEKRAQAAWLFLLFNPFVLLTTSAWGQFDTVVALLCVASLYFLSRDKIELTGLSLGVAVALKPVALPLVGLPFLFSATRYQPQKNLRYLLVIAAVVLTCYLVPFYLLGWTLPLASSEWNAHFTMAGGMSLFSFLEIFQGSLSLPSALDVLGYLWVPALLVGYYFVYRNRPTSMADLTRKAVGVTLIFFLTRSWLSEPNVNLVLPLMLLAVESDMMNFRSFHFAWIIPLVFMFPNTSFPQLFFLVHPSIPLDLQALDQQIRVARLIARFLVVVFWQIFAWFVVVKTLRRKATA